MVQVGANTTAASAVEETHNATLNEQRKKQERIAEYTTAIHVIRELYKQSMQNTDGFGQESAYYRLIGENALYIVTNIPVAVSWLSKKAKDSVYSQCPDQWRYQTAGPLPDQY